MAFNGYINLPSIINYTNCYKTLLNAEKLYLKEAEMINKSIEDGTWRNNFIYWKWFGTSQTGGVSYKYIKYSNNIAGSLDSKYSIGLSNDISYAGSNVVGYPGKGNLTYTYKNLAGSYDTTLAMKEINLVINPIIDTSVIIIDPVVNNFYSNWLKMHMLDQKIYNANAGGKLIEIYEKESNKLVDTVAILGGFITVAGFMKAGSLIAEQPFRDVSNYLKPSTFNEYIMPNYGTASSYVSNLINNSSSVLGNINKLSINQANVEALKQSTVADIGNATATGTFIYGSMGTLAKNILKATLKYGKWVLPAADFLYQTDELGVGSDFAYNGITYTTKTRPVTTQTDNWQYQQTVTQHTSNQATTEATAGTTTQADEHQQADTSAQEGKLNELKDSIKGIKEAISSQAKSIVDTLKAMTVNLSIPEGATIPLGFDTQALKDFFTANKLGFDTGTFQEWLGSHGLGIDTASFQTWLSTHGLGIDTASFQTWLSTHGLNIDTSVLAGLLQDGLRVDVPNTINLNAPDSINLVAPESIELVADGLKLGLDETATESIRAISDTYKTYAEKVEARENERVTREETKETRDSERWEKEKELVQNQIDNKVTNNEILAVQHSLYTTKAEGLNYAERNIRAWVNEHSQVEYTTKEGVPLKEGYYSNPQLNQQKDYNNALESESRIKAKNDLASVIQADLQADQKARSEKKIYGFKDINPSSRVDVYGFIKNIFIKKE